MSTIRAFIAIRLPPPVEQALADIGRALALTVPRGGVRWVRPEQIHLTLRFLGDTPVAQLDAIGKAMDAAVTDVLPFSLHLSGVGAFPNTRQPRVIWTGLDGEIKRLHALKSALDEQLTLLGLPSEDKPFRAHLTLGRVKDQRAVEGLEWSVDVPAVELPVTATYLIESRLRPDGPVYTERHVSKLRDSKQ